MENIINTFIAQVLIIAFAVNLNHNNDHWNMGV